MESKNISHPATSSSYPAPVSSSAEMCYLFNPGSFFNGVPPQSMVTKYFVENKERFKYTEFPVLDVENHYYEFYRWDDPEAVKVWKPFSEKGILIEDPSTISDDEEDYFTEEQIEESIQRKELFAYYAAEAETTFFEFSSDCFEDPLQAFRTIMHNPFTSDQFTSQMDEIVHTFLTQEDKPQTEQEYSQYSTDVAATNLQMLVNLPMEEIKVLKKDSFPLSKAINDNLPPDQEFKHKLHFLNYLSQDEKACSNMFNYPSIKNAILLIRDNTIIDLDSNNFSKFVEYHYPSAYSKIGQLLDYFHAKGITGRKPDFSELRRKMTKGRDFQYQSYLQFMQRTRSKSPEYRPRSPTFGPAEKGVLVEEEPVPPSILDEKDYKCCLTCLVSYIYFRFGSFEPDGVFVNIFFPSKKKIKEDSFYRKFRIRNKCVFFGTSYKRQINVDTEKFIREYIRTKDNLSFLEE
jgi:hypothetical protein